MNPKPLPPWWLPVPEPAPEQAIAPDTLRQPAVPAWPALADAITLGPPPARDAAAILAAGRIDLRGLVHAPARTPAGLRVPLH